MRPLYKYLPSRFVSSLLDSGNILFRNLTYFRQHEGNVRGDIYEGIHQDRPGSGVVIENLRSGKKVTGDFAFHNSINQDLVFAFCLSEVASKDLLREFECDSCIEIFNPEEFVRRIKFSVARKISVNHRTGLIAQSVHYYHPASPVHFDVKNPQKIVFSKHESYAHQAEYRLCFGVKKSFELIERIVQPSFDPWEEVMRGKSKDKMITIGNIDKIARLVTL